MGFLRCTRDDPLTSRVRELYGANIVRAPRVGLDPLDVLARKGDHVEKRGALAPLISGEEPLDLPPVADSPAAEISGHRSVTVDADLGAELGAAFVAALGVPVPGAAVRARLWQGAREFSFEVRDVRERQIDVNALGRSLKGRRIDTASPAAALYLDGGDVRMHIVSRTLTSPHIAVRVTGGGGQSLEADVDAISDLLGEAEAQISWRREHDGAVAFRGPHAATFALAALPCNLGPEGTFTLGLEIRDASYLDVPGAEEVPLLVAAHLPLVNQDGLLDVD